MGFWLESKAHKRKRPRACCSPWEFSQTWLLCGVFTSSGWYDIVQGTSCHGHILVILHATYATNVAEQEVRYKLGMMVVTWGFLVVATALMCGSNLLSPPSRYTGGRRAPRRSGCGAGLCTRHRWPMGSRCRPGPMWRRVRRCTYRYRHQLNQGTARFVPIGVMHGHSPPNMHIMYAH